MINFLSIIKTISTEKTRDGISVDIIKMAEIMFELQKSIEDFESIVFEKDTEIESYANEIKNNDAYTKIKNELKLTDDTYKNAELFDLFGKTDQKVSFNTTIIVAGSRLVINKQVPILLQLEIPDKYENIK